MTLEIFLSSLFIVSFIVQLIFIAFVFGKLAFYKENLPPYQNSNKKNTNESASGISIIVAAHNEFENLKNLVPALLSQNHSNFQIIIVNDRSTDESAEYLNDISQENPFLTQIIIDKKAEFINPKKYALQCGVKTAKNNLLVFTDADCIPLTNNWLNEMQYHYRNPKTEIVLGYSQYIKYPGWLNKFIRFETFYTAIQYFSLALNKIPYMGVGRNLSYKKTLFLKNDGFGKYKNITGGDDDLFTGKHANHLNTKIVINKNSQTSSVPKENIKDWIIQKTRHLSVSRHYKFIHKIVLGLLNISHIYFYILLFIMSILEININLILLGYFSRLFFLVYIYKLIAIKLEDSISVWLIPLFDFIYIIYLIIIGPIAIYTKKVKWK